MEKELYFFSTCLVEHFYPKVGLDGVALLELAGYTVRLPNYQSCCGQPAYNSGAEKDAASVAKRTIDMLSESDIPVVVPSASCADMLIHHYPLIFQEDPAYYEKAQSLAARSHELLSFILPELPEHAHSEKAKPFRLHISCSTRRGTRSAQAWKAAAEQLSAYLGEPKYASECCGFGGTFSVKAPEISSALAEDKCSHLGADEAGLFLSGDCGCLMHLNGYAEKQGIPLKGRHLVSVLAEMYGVGDAE